MIQNIKKIENLYAKQRELFIKQLLEKIELAHESDKATLKGFIPTIRFQFDVAFSKAYEEIINK